MLRDGARRLHHTRVSAPCELPTSHVRGFVRGTLSRTVEAASQPSQQILRAADFERDILSEQWRQSRQRSWGEAWSGPRTAIAPPRCSGSPGAPSPGQAQRVSPTMRVDFSAPLSRKILAFSIQALLKWCRYLQTHRRPTPNQEAREWRTTPQPRMAGHGVLDQRHRPVDPPSRIKR